MPFVTISEYQRSGRDVTGTLLAAALEPADFVHNVNLDIANNSEFFAPTTHFIRVVSDVDIRYSIGPGETITDNHAMIVAGQTEYFAVRPGARFSAMIKSD
ncbi:MAG: hypothetical protein LPH21_06355 [Shewanella sp.]|nr:hypothetical protein [Shewanella sp.]